MNLNFFSQPNRFSLAALVIACLILGAYLIRYAEDLYIPPMYTNMTEAEQWREFTAWQNAYDQLCGAAGGISEEGGFPCTEPFDHSKLPRYTIPQDNPAYAKALQDQALAFALGTLLLIASLMTGIWLYRRTMPQKKSLFVS
jgi:hypothetical protein